MSWQLITELEMCWRCSRVPGRHDEEWMWMKTGLPLCVLENDALWRSSSAVQASWDPASSRPLAPSVHLYIDTAERCCHGGRMVGRVFALDELHGDKEGRPSWQETEQRMKDLTGYWFERTLGTRIEVAKNEGGVISAWRVMLVSVTGMLGTRATGRHQNVGVFSCRFSRICRHVGQAEPQKARSQRWCWFLLGAARATEVWTSSDGEACESNPNRRGL